MAEGCGIGVPGVASLLAGVLLSLGTLVSPVMAATSLRGPGGVVVEEIPQVRQIATGTTETTAIVGRFAAGPYDTPQLVTSYEKFAQLFGNGGGEVGAVRMFFENGGATAYVVRVRDAQPGSVATGLSALDGTGFQLLAVPLTYDMDIPGAAQAIEVAIRLAAKKGAFYFIDVPRAAASISEVTDFRSRFSSPDAAIYYPALNTASGTVPASGAVAGRYAWTDRQRGFWKPPTEPLIGVSGLATGLRPNELTALAERRGVNVIENAGGRGYRASMHRTLSDDPEQRYVSVVRMQRIIEQSLREGLGWAAYEPQNQNTWNKIRSAVEQYLSDLHRKGAFQGSTPRQAYYVTVGPLTGANGSGARLPISVGFAPSRPAEFIITRIALTMK